MQSFPDITSLAQATQDQVLHHWSGLGYYARARNLHKAAQVICEQYNGEFPQTIEEVIELPGIGQSTAAAILSLSLDQPHAILDGNVKRVLARHTATRGWPGKTNVATRLWAIAEQRTPVHSNSAYTQAMMDLGALICTRRQPKCDVCPVQLDCQARSQHLQHELPEAKPKKSIPTRKTVMLVVTNQDEQVLMQKRPNHGIWGGLWSFPEFENEDQAVNWCCMTFSRKPEKSYVLESLTHTFSHFRLEITPISAHFSTPINWVMDANDWVWYKHGTSQAGLAAPVNQLINQLAL